MKSRTCHSREPLATIKMTRQILITAIAVLTLLGCTNNSEDSQDDKQSESNKITTPHLTVLKLLNAEGFADIDECKKYLDPKEAYKEYDKFKLPEPTYNIDTTGKTTGELTWEWHLKHYYNKGLEEQDMGSHWDFFNYDIEETVHGEVAIVELIPTIKNRRIMWFRLVMQDKGWIVVKRKLIEN